MQGFNMGRYVPPEFEGTKSANAVQSKHALGARASKLRTQGILTVRFEMPYAIWCTTCQPTQIIGQGVRFNAEKKKAGNYYTTPIWSFRMKHTSCGGWIEIRTDPKNTAYEVVSGAKKRDTGEEKVLEGDQVFLTAEEREKLRSNAFASLEKTIEDREQLKAATVRIEDLLDVSKRQWGDTYSLNQRLRAEFRLGRHEREKLAAATEDLKERMGLGVELLPETEEDSRRAALVDFGQNDEGNDEGSVVLREHEKKVLGKALFLKQEKRVAEKPGERLLRGEKEGLKRKKEFASEVIGNTRVATDPFLTGSKSTERRGTALPGVKRKRRVVEEGSARPAEPVKADGPVQSLVNYDSD